MSATSAKHRHHEGPSKTDPLRALLRKSGYKATPSRLAILAVFKKNREPLSAQQIVDLLPGVAGVRRGRRTLDQATVYRTLKSFKGKGIIRPIDLRHNHAHYELVNTTDHHHLICLRCGRIEEVEHRGVEAMERTILQNAKHFAEIKQHTLEFYGICKACERKEK
ncbi:MAG TPA: Fur family transcriptional regulator [Candidatus Paceibacterota bacterium]|nr:Fur family transcriptional regulator [Candidatus Paceibacterota bacterium]